MHQHKYGVRHDKRPRPASVPLSRYVRAGALPTPPASVDYTAPAMTSLHNWFGNDVVGDCVIAAGYHILGTVTGNAGALFIPTYQQCIDDYSAIAGYVPGNPETDVGSDPVGAMFYWRKNGFACGDKIIGWAKLDPQNHDQVKTALWLFENLFIEVCLSWAWDTAALTNYTDSFVWDYNGSDYAPSIALDHMVGGHGYNATGIRVSTWGRLGTMTWAAWDKYMAPPTQGFGCWTFITQDHIQRGQTLTASGLDWATLFADLAQLGGNAGGQRIKRGRWWRNGRRAESF